MTQQTPPPAPAPLPNEIDLTIFADAINNARGDNNTCLVASANGSMPDIAFKGSLMVWDKDHLAWWERSQRETFAAVKANPNVAVFVRNPARDRRVVRLYGQASIAEDPALRERVWERVPQVEKDQDKEKKGVALLVRVDRVRAAGQDIRRS